MRKRSVVGSHHSSASQNLQEPILPIAMRVIDQARQRNVNNTALSATPGPKHTKISPIYLNQENYVSQSIPDLRAD